MQFRPIPRSGKLETLPAGRRARDKAVGDSFRLNNKEFAVVNQKCFNFYSHHLKTKSSTVYLHNLEAVYYKNHDAFYYQTLGIVPYS